MANRTTPNSSFAWYNDDDRLAIVVTQSSSDSSKGTTAGTYDTFLENGNLSGTITDADCSGTTITITSAAHGLATNDKVSISGTTNFNDDNLASQAVPVSDANTFTMTRSTSSSSTNETGSWTSLFVDDGIRLTIHSKYETLSALTDDLQTTGKLDNMMHAYVLDYVKSRILEDIGQVEQSQYFRVKYENGIAKKPTRKSGVRILVVPEL